MASLFEKIKMSNEKALKTGFGTGLVQVSSLLWLRTVTNYQYKHGISMKNAFKNLYNDGGIFRFYRGYIPAIVTASICKMGDLNGYYLVNDPNLNLNLNNFEKNIIIASISNTTRFIVMPIDTLDMFLQVEGSNGMKMLKNKIKTDGIQTLYHGCSMWLTTNFIGSFVWFGTYQTLEPIFTKKNNFNNAIIGFGSSMMSDIATNPLRSLKVYKQSNHISINYLDSFKEMVHDKGIINMMTRGLFTRVMTHGIQSAMFVVVWKNIEDYFNKNK